MEPEARPSLVLGAPPEVLRQEAFGRRVELQTVLGAGEAVALVLEEQIVAAMKEKGFHVTGSDTNVYPPMSTFLAERKIEVMPTYAQQNLAHKPDLVVIGNAISRGNPEVEAVVSLAGGAWCQAAPCPR